MENGSCFVACRMVPTAASVSQFSSPGPHARIHARFTYTGGRWPLLHLGGHNFHWGSGGLCNKPAAECSAKRLDATIIYLSKEMCHQMEQSTCVLDLIARDSVELGWSGSGPIAY